MWLVIYFLSDLLKTPQAQLNRKQRDFEIYGCFFVHFLSKSAFYQQVTLNVMIYSPDGQTNFLFLYFLKSLFIFCVIQYNHVIHTLQLP